MLKKLMLCHQIKRFYKQFAEVLDYNPSVRLSYLKCRGFLLDVQFAINEIRDAQAECFCAESYALGAWLDKLYNNIDTIKECAKYE